MEAKATAKYVRMSSTKLKPVADLVRGKKLNEALTILKFTSGKASLLVEKVVQSAAANAENNHELNPDNLYISEITANKGPVMKRWRAGAKGRASRINHKTSHISVVLRPIPGTDALLTKANPEKPAQVTKAEKSDMDVKADKPAKDAKAQAVNKNTEAKEVKDNKEGAQNGSES